MTHGKIFLAVTLGLLLASSYLVASGPVKKDKARVGGIRVSTSKKPGPKFMNAAEFMPRPRVLEAKAGINDPVRSYTIEPHPKRGHYKSRTEQEDRLFEQAAALLLRHLPVPPERQQFYSWIGEENYPFQVYGWSAFVETVTPIPGGSAIRLKVWPKITTKAQVVSAYFEEYTSVNGVLSFSKGYGDPSTPGINILW